MESFKNSPLYLFETADQWRDWLDKNHSLTPCVWLKLAKKGSDVTTLSYEQARNTAIAYGWIDGLINGLDKDVYLTRFTPRKPKSVWSKANREVAEGLIESGRMQPSGMACVEAARKGGMWERAYDGASTMAVPEDFQRALDVDPLAAKAFDALNAANRYAFLWRIQTAGSQESREKRINNYIKMLAAGDVFH